MQVKNFGQVFTPDHIVEEMLSLRKNKGTILEPSCGTGAFFNKIENCVGIELDGTKCPKNALNIDFFDYSDASNLCNIRFCFCKHGHLQDVNVHNAKLEQYSVGTVGL